MMTKAQQGYFVTWIRDAPAESLCAGDYSRCQRAGFFRSMRRCRCYGGKSFLGGPLSLEELLCLPPWRKDIRIM